MRTRPLALIALPLALTALAGCAPKPYVAPEPPKFTESIEGHHSDGAEGIREIKQNFEITYEDSIGVVQIRPCEGEETGIGRTVTRELLQVSNREEGLESLRSTFSVPMTLEGNALLQSEEEITFADGTTTTVVGEYILFEDERGSWLVDAIDAEAAREEDGDPGVITVINRTACGVLR